VDGGDDVHDTAVPDFADEARGDIGDEVRGADSMPISGIMIAPVFFAVSSYLTMMSRTQGVSAVTSK